MCEECLLREEHLLRDGYERTSRARTCLAAGEAASLSQDACSDCERPTVGCSPNSTLFLSFLSSSFYCPHHRRQAWRRTARTTPRRRRTSSECTIGWARRLAKGRSVSSSRVRDRFRCDGPEWEAWYSWEIYRDEPAQFADRRDQIRMSSPSFVAPQRHRLNYSHVLQEPRKSDAPQLRDECRSYRILAGCRACAMLSEARRGC